VGIVSVVAVLLFDKVSKPFLLVLRAESEAAKERAEIVLKKSGVKFSLSSFVSNAAYTEVIFELGLAKKDTKFMSLLKEIPGVTNVSLVDCHKS
jgi:hypothetical protein